MMFCSAPDPLAVFKLMHDRYPEQLPQMMRAFPTHGGMGHGAVAQLSLFHGSGDVYDVVMDTGLPFCDPNIWSEVRSVMMKTLFRACDLLVRVRRYDPGFATMMSYGSRCAAIHVAAYQGNLGVLEKLIERKVDINSTEHHWKMTPLHLAVISGHEAICARLVSLGAAIETKDKRGRTALDWAKRLDREDIMQLLLAAVRRKQISGAPRATARV